MELLAPSIGLIIWTLVVPVLILWILALVSVLRNDFEGTEKLIWVLVIIFVPFLGSILYFAIGRSKRIKTR